jgi:putative ABC transport system permease protein
MPLETLQYAVHALQNQKLRSYLNLLSIIIGMAAIVALISLGNGLNASISSELDLLGSEIVFVQPGSISNPTSVAFSRIDEEDIKTVEGIAGVEAVIGFYEASSIITKGQESRSGFFIGIDPKKQTYLAETGYLEIVDGRFLGSGDTTAIMVDEDFVTNAFDKEVGLRQNVEIKGKKFTIVGILKKNSLASSFGTNLLWMPRDTVKSLFNEPDPTELIVKVVSADRVTEVAEKIEARLERKHNEKRVSVLTPDNLAEQIQGILGSMQIVLLAIASISLLVGAIGITNTMIVNVLNRTREIGLMKAVGATDGQVLVIFALEAVLMGLGGGIVGGFIGTGIALIASQLISGAGFDLPVTFDVILILQAGGFAAVVGLLAGIAPAKRAADLDPSQALRWE